MSEPWQTALTEEQRRLFADLTYCPETGLFRWAVNGRGQTKRAGNIAGSAHSGGYVRIKHGGRTYFAHRLAWLFHSGHWPACEIDHINGDRKDNRIANLREASVAQNRRNTKGVPSRRKHSAFKGVTKDSRDKNPKWVAQIYANGKVRVLGRFLSEDEAAKAYQSAAKELHGEFARW